MRQWQPYSRLLMVDDRAAWVIDNEAKEVAAIARKMGIRLGPRRWADFACRQSVFYSSQFFLLSDTWRKSNNRVAMAYFHGRPGTGISEFDQLFEKVHAHHAEISRIQVSHSEMRNILLSAGVAQEKLFLIPIGINLGLFPQQTTELRRQARSRYGIPESAVVIGSFQKDGVGWDEGLEPKLIKGPDIFLKTIEQLKSRLPQLFILLSGPARGYVKKGLEQLRVPYRHLMLKHYAEVAQLYQAIDLCLVTSRQEGGPKAVLEAMASGVPLVTTRVGQAMDIVRHKENGFMVEVQDVEGLAHWSQWILEHQSEMNLVLKNGRQTAGENTYERQVPAWRTFMDGFVEMGNQI
jgi:glycosyltransferase involved in cell wall biosynthesis